RRVIDSGPSAESRRNKPSRVASASAANTGTASWSLSAALLLRDIARELLGLRGPPLVVLPERFGTAVQRDSIQPRLDDRQRRSFLRVVKTELDQRRGFARVIDLGVECVRMPAVGEVMLRVDPLDEQIHGQVIVVWDRELAADRCAGGEL